MTKVLTDKGINVALLEAGPGLNPEKDFKMLDWPYSVPHRGAGEGGASYFGRGRPFGFFSAHAGGWFASGALIVVEEAAKAAFAAPQGFIDVFELVLHSAAGVPNIYAREVA